jgi:uncharacterized protein with HEPN domain
MRTKAPKLLEDIRDAAAYIREIARDRTLDDYQRDRMLRQTIERNFEIIGEAVNRLAQHDPDTAARIRNHRQILDFRNVLMTRLRPDRPSDRTEYRCPENPGAARGGRIVAERSGLKSVSGIRPCRETGKPAQGLRRGVGER